MIVLVVRPKLCNIELQVANAKRLAIVHSLRRQQINVMNLSDPIFAERYPDGCPLIGANKCEDDDVFLLCNEVCATDTGFRSLHEKGGLRKKGSPGAICKSMGLSVFSSLEDCQRHRGFFPYLGKKIAAAKLGEDRGDIMRTGESPGHHTWWSPLGSDRSAGFKVVYHVEN